MSAVGPERYPSGIQVAQKPQDCPCVMQDLHVKPLKGFGVGPSGWCCCCMSQADPLPPICCEEQWPWQDLTNPLLNVSNWCKASPKRGEACSLQTPLLPFFSFLFVLLFIFHYFCLHIFEIEETPSCSLGVGHPSVQDGFRFWSLGSGLCRSSQGDGLALVMSPDFRFHPFLLKWRDGGLGK